MLEKLAEAEIELKQKEIEERSNKMKEETERQRVEMENEERRKRLEMEQAERRMAEKEKAAAKFEIYNKYLNEQDLGSDEPDSDGQEHDQNDQINDTGFFDENLI